jgi:hypothetical protein
MRSNKLKDIEWEYHFAGQMFCEMLCQVAIKEIIARDMAGRQEVPFFLVYEVFSSKGFWYPLQARYG